MKRVAVVIGIILLAGLIAYPVFAHGPGWGGGRGHHMMGNRGPGPGYCWQYGGGYANVTPEQQSKLDELYQNFYNETNNLKNEIWSKSRELNTLLDSPDPDIEKAKALQKEISDLRSKMAEKRLDFQLETRKINPDARFGAGYGKGYGRHMRGYGPRAGMGYGKLMGGYGQGPCWN